MAHWLRKPASIFDDSEEELWVLSLIICMIFMSLLLYIFRLSQIGGGQSYGYQIAE